MLRFCNAPVGSRSLTLSGAVTFNINALCAFRGRKMEDFPIWLKLVIWGTIGLTVGYTIWGMINSMGQS